MTDIHCTGLYLQPISNVYIELVPLHNGQQTMREFRLRNIPEERRSPLQTTFQLFCMSVNRGFVCWGKITSWSSVLKESYYANLRTREG